MSPKVSIVIPTYRRLELLERALKSVLRQTFVDFEVLVVDDNGIDHPSQLAVEQMIKGINDDRFRYLPNDDSLGGGAARNVGIQHAEGKYIAFLDDDEDWLPEKLSKQVALMDKSSEEFAVIDTGFYDTKNESNYKITLPQMSGWILNDLLGKTVYRAPKLSTMLCRKSALVDVGMFDVNLPARQDLDLYIRLARKYQFKSIYEPLAYKRHDADSRISKNPANRIKGYEILYEKIKQDLKQNPTWHANYIMNYADLLVRDKRFDDAANAYLKSIKITPWHFSSVIRGFYHFIKMKLK